MIERLSAALGKEFNLTSKEIADVVWLALQMEASVLSFQTGEASDVGGEAKTAKRSSQNSSTSGSGFNRGDDKKSPSPQAELHATNSPSDGEDGFDAGVPLAVPDARSLREPLSLAKSLKPLLQKVSAGWSTMLDEVATVERVADERIWMPVLKPALEPWLELALVVEESLSMHLWQRTVGELQRLFAHYGVFRDVRVWSLTTDDLGRVQIRPRLGNAARRQSVRHPRELIDPSGRRLILVATDCVSQIWQDGSVLPVLKLWASSSPMAIVQMLPEWLWSRTGLGLASAVRFHSLMPGVPNQRLEASDLSPWDEVDLEAGISVPVVTLEPEPFLAWANMMSARGGTQSPGFVFELEAMVSWDESRQWNASVEETAQERVQQFRSMASPMARRLAGLLAAAPVVSLPVVRILRERLLPKSRQVHVAEVFLGGLLKPLLEIQLETDPDVVQYEFLDGVRNLLLESVPTKDSVDVLDEVSAFVAERMGLSVEEFVAVLRNPRQAENRELASQSRPFARVAARILRQLGGEYARFAQELESIPFLNKTLVFNPAQRNDRVHADIYWHQKGFTLEDARRVKKILERKGIPSKIMPHRDPDSPDAIFIGALVDAEQARIAISTVPYPINYIFPLEYPEHEGGDSSGQLIGIGYMSTHNQFLKKSKKSIPIKIEKHDLNRLTEVGISNQEFRDRLKRILRSSSDIREL